MILKSGMGLLKTASGFLGRSSVTKFFNYVETIVMSRLVFHSDLYLNGLRSKLRVSEARSKIVISSCVYHDFRAATSCRVRRVLLAGATRRQRTYAEEGLRVSEICSRNLPSGSEALDQAHRSILLFLFIIQLLALSWCPTVWNF